jgi:hypothetical protein
MVKDEEIVCKNCGWHWKLSDGGKDPYTCHKCKYNNKDMIKLKDILNEMISEMGIENDWGTKNVIDAFNTGDKDQKNNISIEFTGKPDRSIEDIKKAILDLEKVDFDKKLKALGLYNLEEKKEKPGLWANIRAQRARGEKPARKGSEEYKKAVKAAKEINKATKK